MNLFLTDVYISVDMLSPIVHLLSKNKMKVGILNCNCIQDHTEDNVLSYLIHEDEVTYFKFLPLNFPNKIIYYFVKLLLKLPKFILTRMTTFWFFIARKKNFICDTEFNNFLIKNNIKTITICENFQKRNLEKVRKISKLLEIPLILVPSGLRLDEVKNLEMKKINFCDHYLNPNKIQIDSNKTKKNLIMGSPRYHTDWFKTLESIYRFNVHLKKNDKLKIAAFVKSGSHFGENDLFYELINKLKKTENIEIKIKNKPSDILPNKCAKFLKDGYSSTELIEWSDIIITGRPSSVLVEAIIKDKYIFLINYNNPKIEMCNFYNFEIINKLYNENDMIEKIQSFIDQSGNRTPWSPELTLGASAAYRIDLGSKGTLTPYGQFYYSGDYNTSNLLANDPNHQQKAYTKSDLRLSWHAPSEDLSVELFVENIENSAVLARGNNNSDDIVQTSYLYPRNYGIKLKTKF